MLGSSHPIRWLLGMLLVSGCAAHPPKPNFRTPSPPPLADDLALEPLLEAVAGQADHLERKREIAGLRFGARVVDKAVYVAGLRRFVTLGRESGSKPAFLAAVEREFTLEALTGELLVTSYYEPIFAGARVAGGRFSQALYRAPAELVKGKPFRTRAEIDSGHALRGRGLELCWVDPLDAFIIQTEGSGTIAFADGTELALAYAGNNGQPHARLGQHVPEAARANMHTLTAHLRGLPEAEMRKILEKNPRYIFFSPRTGGPPTSIGLPATDGRTIAADPKVHPKGGLALLVTTQPILNGLVPVGWPPLVRFVLDQDTGSAIVGPRVDLFWGRGEEAGRYAGVMKQPGRLFYLVPR